MDHISIAFKSQENIYVKSKIDDSFDRFRVGTLLRRCGARKRHGHGVRSLTQAIFTLPFVGKNFFCGIVINQKISFGKNAAYQLLRERPTTGADCFFGLDNDCTAFSIASQTKIERPCS